MTLRSTPSMASTVNRRGNADSERYGVAIDDRRGGSTNGTAAPISATRCSARAASDGIGKTSALALRQVSSSCVSSAAEPAEDA